MGSTVSLRSIVTSLLVLSLLPLPAVGQEVGASPPVPPRVASLTAGLGNVMGWFGLHGEGYFARERLSGFVGLGYTPSVDEGDPSGPTFAIGLRGFTTGIKHRGFLALSLSQLATETGAVATVPVRHPAQFADAVERLLDDDEARRRLGRVGADLYRDRFGMARTIDTVRGGD